MSFSRVRLLALAATLLWAVVGVSPAAAQGVTTGAIGGRVTDPGGQPVVDAQVQVRNAATGFSNGTITRGDGRYSVLGLEVGNYTVTVRRIGFAPAEVAGVRVTLGVTTPVNVVVQTQATTLQAVTIEADAPTAAVISPTRTGSSTTITDSALVRLPTLNRNFTDFVRLTPQVSNSGPGQSGGGTNNRFNNIQIDGATESDLFGLGSSGQPGGQAGGKSISIESVKEYQVLLSPYDVRQGFFSGALINAVTKGGANDFFGSVYGFGRNQSLTREQPYINDFEQAQYGFSLGGPIVRDRVLFFVNPEFQTRTQPASGNYVGRPNFAAVSQADLDRIAAAVQTRGLGDLGTGGQITNENPLANIFGRLDFNLGSTQLVLRHNYGRAEDDIFSRTTGNTPSFPLSNNGYFFESTKNASVLQARTQFGFGGFNELILGYNTIRDRRQFRGPAQPQVEVGVGSEIVGMGAERSSQANQLDQDIFEVTNNFTFPAGAHSVTIGTQNQFVKFRNLFGQQAFGRWRFDNVAALEAGTPFAYSIGVPVTNGVVGSGDGAVRFSSALYSGYVQDEWQATDNLRFTLGVRADVSTFRDEPPFNQQVQDAYDRNTSEIPSGNIQWSPRFGFNWDVTGDRRNQLRGGVGMFTGRPAYVWLSNAFQNSGLSGYAQLTCGSATTGIPTFTAANVSAPPTTCPRGQTASAASEINLLDPDLKFPQNLRATLGYDRDLGAGFIWTLEGMYTRGVNNLFYQNIALADATGAASQNGIGAGAHGRVVYGNTPGNPRIITNTSRTMVLEAINQGEDYAYSVTTGLTRRFLDNFEGSFFYTYGRAFDVQSLSSSTANSQYRFGRVVSGSHAELNTTPSRFDQPVRIVASGTYSFKTKTDVSLVWIGESGDRYDYVAQQDLNGDGFDQNDPIYVPTSAFSTSEIQFAPITQGTGASQTVVATVAQQQQAFEEFIQGTKCLRENRGRILPRLACQNPFTNQVDLSIRQSLPSFRGQTLSVALDIINFGNLLNSNWGIQPEAGLTPVRLLSGSNTLVGGTTLQAGGEPRYQFSPSTQRFDAARLGSNYQMQLSVRYSF